MLGQSPGRRARPLRRSEVCRASRQGRRSGRRSGPTLRLAIAFRCSQDSPALTISCECPQLLGGSAKTILPWLLRARRSAREGQQPPGRPGCDPPPLTRGARKTSGLQEAGYLKACVADHANPGGFRARQFEPMLSRVSSELLAYGGDDHESKLERPLVRRPPP